MVPKICSVDDCNRKHKARGYCSVHYSEWFRSATPEERRGPTREERFWAKVEKTSTCWHWTATLNDAGYGIFHDGNRNVRAHRYSYEMVIRPIEQGLVLDHICHNDSGCTDVPCLHRRCVNPAHLEEVTQKVNAIRGRSGDHQLAKTHCPHGHEYTPENTLTRRGTTYRGCRACSREANRKYQSKRKVA